MAGQIKRTIDYIVEQRAKGSPVLAVTTRTKFILKGVDADRYTTDSPDDLTVLARVRSIAAEMGVLV